MSTSPVTSLSRLLSNKPTVTLRVSARVAACALAAASFAAGVCFGVWGVPGVLALKSQIEQRRANDAKLAPLIEQAKLMPVGYDLATPGAVVDWCIDHPSPEFSYLESHQSEPILWTNEDAVPITYGAESACTRMIARVVSREVQGLKLTYLGKP